MDRIFFGHFMSISSRFWPKTSIIWRVISKKSAKNLYFDQFSWILRQTGFFPKNRLVTSVWAHYCPSTLCEVSERYYDQFSRKTPDRRTDIGPTSRVSGSKKSHHTIMQTGRENAHNEEQKFIILTRMLSVVNLLCWFHLSMKKQNDCSIFPMQSSNQQLSNLVTLRPTKYKFKSSYHLSPLNCKIRGVGNKRKRALFWGQKSQKLNSTSPSHF